jgi:diguanylate cyclase (GGDEF)-like protein
MHGRRELGAARREQRPVCLMLWAVPELDIYRQTFGQKSADSCLRMIGTQITGTFRRGSDLCARFDESTLGVIVAGLDEEQSGRRVAGVERKVRHLALHNPRGRLSRYLAVHGVAVQASQDELLESLFARGAEALAAAARAGNPDTAVPA